MITEILVLAAYFAIGLLIGYFITYVIKKMFLRKKKHFYIISGNELIEIKDPEFKQTIDYLNKENK